MAKTAVLVGINRYQQPGSDLRGCVNDVKDMRDTLMGLCGFPESGIKVLTDLEATKAAIQGELERVVKAARLGDVVFVHYAGHGSNVPDTSGDESDFRDEILCPTDLDWKDPLRDDWLRSLFDTVAEGVNLTVVLDCCYSGTGTRALRAPDSHEPVERFLPCPVDVQAVEAGRELRGSLRRGRRRAEKGAGTDVKDVPLSEILITGCRDDQTSADAYIDGDYHGALTHSLVRSIRDRKGKLSYRDLHRMTTRSMENTYGQAPQLEGRASLFDRPFLAPFV